MRAFRYTSNSPTLPAPLPGKSLKFGRLGTTPGTPFSYHPEPHFELLTQIWDSETKHEQVVAWRSNGSARLHRHNGTGLGGRPLRSRVHATQRHLGPHEGFRYHTGLSASRPFQPQPVST